MKKYSPQKTEKKQQERWEKAKIFECRRDPARPKFYALSMFPYPSGAGLHIGHLASYTPSDAVARYKRARGFNVLHPFGYDAFGLPAEQYAVQTGIHPEKITLECIKKFRRQLKAFGFSFDWSREISTCDPSYYKWTQWFFKIFLKRGLARQTEAPVNWCPALRTVLANEEVADGKSERGGHPVVRKFMKQWTLRITEYAERLLEDLDDLDWPERTKAAQRNWIGRSEGAEIFFPVVSPAKNLLSETAKGALSVFTTRPDTIFGAAFAVIAPEHPLLPKLVSPEQAAAVRAFQEELLRRSRRPRKAPPSKDFPAKDISANPDRPVDRKNSPANLEGTNSAKTNLAKAGREEAKAKEASAAEAPAGVFTGARLQNPVTKEIIPLYTADYVMTGYGTGVIMAVPAHDERDFAFAKAFGLPVKRVVEGGAEGEAFCGDGPHIHSASREAFLDLNGLRNEAAKQAVMDWLQKEGKGKKTVQYKLRDWLFSRQRYWGEPFPVIKGPDGLEPVPDEALPVRLPPSPDYQPSFEGESPLRRIKEFVQCTDSKGRPAERETDTMPGSAGSSWYFLRYLDPRNPEAPFDFEEQKYWTPVDLYIGGAEHSTGHLLYARFWHKVLYDEGLVSHKEPFQKLAHQGVVLGEDGFRMSKSRGNGVDPDPLREKYGADAVRVYICFLGPFERDKPWSSQGIEGSRRFLERLHRFALTSAEDARAEDARAAAAPSEKIPFEKPVAEKSPAKNPPEGGAKKSPEGGAAGGLTEQAGGARPSDSQAEATDREDLEDLKPKLPPSLYRLLHQTIKKVTEDIESLRFNTAISALMIFLNQLERENIKDRATACILARLIMPFAPHLAEEMGEICGEKGFVSLAKWPEWDCRAIQEENVSIGVQVQGRARGALSLRRGAGETEAVAAALKSLRVQKALAGKTIKKAIYRPGKILNLLTD